MNKDVEHIIESLESYIIEKVDCVHITSENEKNEIKKIWANFMAAHPWLILESDFIENKGISNLVCEYVGMKYLIQTKHVEVIHENGKYRVWLTKKGIERAKYLEKEGI